MSYIVTIKLPHAETERRFDDKTAARSFEKSAKNTYGPSADVFISEREATRKTKVRNDKE